MGRIRRHWKRWLMAAVAAAVLLAVGGPYIYINYIKDEAPAALSVDDGDPAPTADSGAPAREGVAGAWKVGGGSQAGYRIDEVRSLSRSPPGAPPAAPSASAAPCPSPSPTTGSTSRASAASP